MEEMDGRRVAAVLTADADLEVGPRLATALDAGPHEIPDALRVNRRKRILLEDLLLLVDLQELAAVVARKAERELRQVVRAEREELRVTRDLIGDDAAGGISIIVPTR